MLCEEMTSEQLFFFTKELFSTLREINRRMDELMWVFRLPSCNQETKDEIKARFIRLQETKFCLIYSIYDIRTKFVKILGEDQYQKVLGTVKLYEELKEL